jgi:phenylacetaldehyde dehydrogenase
MSLTLDRQAELSRPVAHNQLLIGGQWVDSADGARLDTFYPGDGRVYGSVAEAGRTDVDRAVLAARAAFDRGPWARFKPAQRAAALWRLGDLILRDVDELSRLETLDTGKPNHAVRQFEIPTAAGLFHYMSGWATKIEGSTIPISAPGEYHAYTERTPIGVVGLIVPWNFPLVIAAWKIAPALASGNTIVVKPAEWTPLTALHLGALALEAGIPDGVFNVVPGYGRTAGAALTEHPLVDKVSFTGSTATGISVARDAAEHLAPVSLELGGKSANIIFGDADVEAAVNGVVAGVFAAAGQTCQAGARVAVHESLVDEVTAKLVERANAIRLGDPADPETEMGPLAFPEQHQKVLDCIRTGVEDGGTILTGGGAPDGELADGLFIAPTLFSGLANGARLNQQEIFGPVASIIPFSTEEEAVQLANDVSYGLAAGIWTPDIQRAHRVAGQIRAGTVWINAYRVISPSVPFGGFKSSGYGREGGRRGIDEFLETKSVWVELSGDTRDPFKLG